MIDTWLLDAYDNKVEHEKILVADQDQVDDSAASILSRHIETFKELAK
ncbi:hypothetical protein JDW15_09995 [Aerococcaceae bacterium zg-ZJ1578]|nr:hypothetical protein [Aerococcaceae bacterium zg-1578]